MRAAPSRSETADALDTDGRPSKSALKRQMHELQALGLALAELPISRSASWTCPNSCATLASTTAPARTRAGAASCSSSAS
jgi:ribosomal 50S subunit-associated protein YjgA (DUF615 family)